jgi:hypothetical protein
LFTSAESDDDLSWYRGKPFGRSFIAAKATQRDLSQGVLRLQSSAVGLDAHIGDGSIEEYRVGLEIDDFGGAKSRLDHYVHDVPCILVQSVECTD